MTRLQLAAAAVTGAAAIAVAGCGQSKRPTPRLPRPMTDQQLIERASRGVVAVKARGEDGVTTGTGWLVSAQEVITADHVVASAENLKVRFGDGTKIPARIVGESVCNDRALLRLTQPVPNPTILPMADGRPLGSNTRVDLLHYGEVGAKDFGTQQMSTSPLTVANPRVENPSLGPSLPRLDDLLQLQGVVPAGASGAPVLDANGLVNGMLVLGETKESQAYALPVGPIRQALTGLRADDRRDWLGLKLESIRDVDLAALFRSMPALRRHAEGWAALVRRVLRREHSEGLFVWSVADNGPAHGHVYAGDMITHINGMRISSVNGLCGAMQSTAPGDKITIDGTKIVVSDQDYWLDSWEETVRTRR